MGRRRQGTQNALVGLGLAPVVVDAEAAHLALNDAPRACHAPLEGATVETGPASRLLSARAVQRDGVAGTAVDRIELDVGGHDSQGSRSSAARVGAAQEVVQEWRRTEPCRPVATSCIGTPTS